MIKILRVYMDSLTVAETPVDEQYRGLGGRGLTSEIIFSEVPACCHPLDKKNKLVFSPGLLAGTAAANSGRLSAGAKSPLTGTIKESNAGGTAATRLAKLGIAALIIEGKPVDDTPYLLKITSEGVILEPAEDLKGLGNYDSVSQITRKHGEKISCLTIGQAGEMKLEAATIAVTDMNNRPTRHCGRGGLGAVMGSKGLKAIIIDDSGAGRPTIADPEKFTKASKIFAKELMEHPVTGESLPKYGTNVLSNIINNAGALPTRNFTKGMFKDIAEINSEKEHHNILSRNGSVGQGCMPGCLIKCSSVYTDRKGKYISKGPEYETVWAHGPNCEIKDLDAIALMDRLEDDYGVDTIETGTAIAIAMEAGIIEFGDTKGAIRLVKEIGKGSATGRVIGSGAVMAGKVLGVEHVSAVKGQALPAYDPRAIQGMGVTYATSPMGADHTAGYCIASNILGCGELVDPLKADRQVELSRNLQIVTAAIDSLGLCIFVAFCLLDRPNALQAVCDMVSARYGISFTIEDLTALGKKILKSEQQFNHDAGFTEKDDRLPDFFMDEKLSPHQQTFLVNDEALDQVLHF